MPFIKSLSIFARKVQPVTAIPSGSAGGGHAMALLSTGRAWGWGHNSFGSIGDNTTTSKFTPVSVAGAVKTFCQISAGKDQSGAQTLAIDKNGRAWGWGSNSRGEVGDFSITQRNTPVSLYGTITFCRISAGYRYSAGIDKNGLVFTWGNNSNGQLGNNSTLSQRAPFSILGALKTFCEITTSNGTTIALDKNGQAWGWGYNANGNIGNNSITDVCTPVSVVGATKTFCKISAGDLHALAIDKNGRAWSWGSDSNGQLGRNIGSLSVRTPISVLGAVKTFCKISAGATYSLAIDKNGRAWAWGRNSSGQLGDNSITQRNTPVSVAGAVKTFCEISAGQDAAGNVFSLAIDKNGKFWAWGSIIEGRTGDNSLTSRRTPVSVLGSVKTFCNIVGSKGGNTTVSLSIDKNGRVWGWGNNGQRQLGDGTNVSKATPVSLTGGVKTFCKIASGEWHSLAIDKTGRLWGWGTNVWGQIGNNSTNSVNTPVSVCGSIKTFCEIATGQYFTMGLDKNGQAWTWGRNLYGELGDNSLISKITPVSVCGSKKTFCKVEANNQTSIAIDKNGRSWSWGLGTLGQLGDNSTTNKCTPVSVCGSVKTFCKISVGDAFVMAIDKNGRAWGWGYNPFGNLGDNSTTNKCTPVSVCGSVKTFCEISTGTGFTIAIDKNGRAWGWGTNNFGVLGDNTLISKRTPVSVLGSIKTFCKISSGTNFTLAIDKNGRAWAWGNDSGVQLGQNITNRLTPVQVCTL